MQVVKMHKNRKQILVDLPLDKTPAEWAARGRPNKQKSSGAYRRAYVTAGNLASHLVALVAPYSFRPFGAAVLLLL